MSQRRPKRRELLGNTGFFKVTDYLKCPISQLATT